jgi:MFS family permease
LTSNTRSSGALWRHQDFLKLWAAQSVSSFGARITREGLPLAAVLSIDAPPGELGVLAALTQGPALIVGLFAGGLVDRSRRRSILIASDVARAAVLLTVPIAAWFHWLSMPLLYGAAALAGMLSALFDIADHAYLPSLIGREQVMEGNSKLGITESIAEIGGPAFAGLLVQALTAPIAIAVNAATYLVSAAFLATIRGRENLAGRTERRPWHRNLAAGFAVIRAQPVLRVLFTLSLVTPLFGSFFSALYVLFAIRTLHLSPAMLGVTIAFGGAGAMAGAALARPLADRFGIGPAIAMLAFLSSLFALLVPLAMGKPALAMAILIAAQLGGDSSGTAFIILARSLRQMIGPGRMLGRVAAVFQVTSGAVGVAGALAGGALAQTIGARTTLLIAAAGYFLLPIIVAASPLSRLQAVPDPAEEPIDPRLSAG